jgi:L-threonylcarbamoyladenylate synthase
VNDLRGGTTAFRCPGDEWLREIIKEVGVPLYSTSVNKSGSPILDTIKDIKSVFEEEVDLIVDDGDKKNSLPSTLVKIEKNGYSILRQGSINI